MRAEPYEDDHDMTVSERIRKIKNGHIKTTSVHHNGKYHQVETFHRGMPKPNAGLKDQMARIMAKLKSGKKHCPVV